MKTVEIECRQINEWDGATQKIIIEKHRHINVEDDWWDSDYEYWADELALAGYDVREEIMDRNGKKRRQINIQFSGFWSQGDGASFTGQIDVLKWLQYHDQVKYRRIEKLIKSDAIEVYGKITRYNSHYVHERSTDVYVEWNFSNNNIAPNIEKLMAELEADIKDDHIRLNKEIYRDLEKNYEGLTSDEAVKETLEANEYEMTNTGKIYG